MTNPPDPVAPTTDAWRRVAALTPFRSLVEHEASRLLVAGVVVGGIGGLAAGVFDHALILIGTAVLGSAEPASEAPVWWRAILGPALCGLGAGALIHWATRGARPQGVPDVMEAVQLDAPSLSLRDGLVSASAAALAVGGGHSGGREGPIVQLASSVAAALCRGLGLPPRHVRSLVAAGAASGVAASFNTPVGGAFFALEILLGDFGVESFAPVVAATVAGTVVGQALLGDRIALHLPDFTLSSPVELGFYLLLGALSGVVAVGFKRSILWGTSFQDPYGLALPIRTALAGLAVGLIASVGLHPVMGNGYGWMEEVITTPERWGAPFLLLLLGAKVAATTATAMGRSGAGLFAPSLYLGAVTGLLSGKAFHFAAPLDAPSAGAYGMVGMGAVAAGVLHAPITMTLMLFEMTGNYEVILPLLVSLSAAGLVSRLLGASSVYEAELARRGVKLQRPEPESPIEDWAKEALPEGHLVEVIEVEGAMVDQTLAELAWPQRRGCLVVAHDQRRSEPERWERLPPDPQRRLAAGDRLVTVGPGAALEAIRGR